ncbi:MAPEG family protein [Francisella frigiditurris]|uniref:MAPEG family protein n=1 Tax=Francisella frigiditurris TaxID=1542390 RepID=A0A1J0KSF1_9GAMM|nr:MAPEG family protein [Francisella frigiditurris]APC96673.1 MAPEG family protein [Francisella frigiditurris]
MTEKQKGVLRGMVIGSSISIAIILVGVYANILSNIDNSLTIAFKALLLPALFLMISIGRLAGHRFFTPEDIDGGGLSVGSEKAKVLQSLLQNTLEQFCLALAAYTAWAVIMPSDTLSVIIYAAIVFAVGRILFFHGYDKGAPSRALGFTLTFYPSVFMLLGTVFYSIVSISM